MSSAAQTSIEIAAAGDQGEVLDAPATPTPQASPHDSPQDDELLENHAVPIAGRVHAHRALAIQGCVEAHDYIGSDEDEVIVEPWSIDRMDW